MFGLLAASFHLLLLLGTLDDAVVAAPQPLDPGNAAGTLYAAGPNAALYTAKLANPEGDYRMADSVVKGVGAGAGVGALIGGFIGAIFGPPGVMAGAAIGGALGAGGGATVGSLTCGADCDLPESRRRS